MRFPQSQPKILYILRLRFSHYLPAYPFWDGLLPRVPQGPLITGRGEGEGDGVGGDSGVGRQRRSRELWEAEFLRLCGAL